MFDLVQLIFKFWFVFIFNKYRFQFYIFYNRTRGNNTSIKGFISIWRIRLKLKDDFAVKSYLYQSVYNEFLNQERNRVHAIPLDKKNIDALSSILEEENEKSLDRLMNLVKREIENLPPKCKQTFLLSKQEGLNNIEISEYLNVSIKSVETHMTKAFSILRKTVGEKMDGVLFLLFGIQKNQVPTTLL